MATTIRLANRDDVARLLELELAAFSSDQFSGDQIRYLVTRATSTVLVIEESGMLVGAAYLLWRERSRSGRLYSISIGPSAQGRGMGDVLLAECERQTVLHGKERLLLEVRVDNDPAIRFYAKHGYDVIGRLPKYYEDGTDGFKMGKSVV